MKSYVARLAGLAFALAALSFDSAIAQAVSARFNGVLTVVWGDPQPGSTASPAIRFTLNLPDGSKHRLQISPDQQNEAIQYFGKRVEVEGRIDSSAALGPSTIVVDNITSVEPKSAEPEKKVKAKTLRVLFILLRYKNDNQETHPVKFYTNELTNPKTPPKGSLTPASINGFFDKTSWGHLHWKGDVAGKGGLNPTDWLTLPGTKNDYAPCGWSGSCANLDGIATDAIALVKAAGVNLSVYDNINFVINNDLDCCAWGGSTFDGGKSYGATWEPPWSQEVGTYVHEMGHSLGLPHSGYVYYAYDSHIDMMSRGHPAKSVQCGTYNSANNGGQRAVNCTEPGAGYIAMHKDYLGWLPSKNKAVFNKKGTHTYTIEAEALPLGSRLKMVKVCLPGKLCDGAQGSTAHFLTIEVKLKVAKYENGLPTEGVMIHDVQMNKRNTASGPCFFNNQSGWAYPKDATPHDFNKSTCGPQDTPGYGLMNMAYTVGKKYSKSPVKIEVLSQKGSTFKVKVTRSK